ncbi:MAG: alpha/beta hydrolase-fold protein [Flavobacteriales bacterium]|nr:alpha/beta hydrolase-fold protein [Flavobacteriales bacterium]
MMPTHIQELPIVQFFTRLVTTGRVFVVLCLFSFPTLLGQKLPEVVSQSDFVLGSTYTINSTVLNENRTLNIYFPANYKEQPQKNYPVIYLLDGSKDEDFIHISGLVQFGTFSWINLLPESIVVGIGNTDRKRDFTYPSRNKLDQEEFPTSGKSESFIRFLTNEVIPFVKATFRTEEHSTIIGQSLGGLIATEILFKVPDTFDHYIIVSPSLWWDDEKLLQIEPKSPRSPKKIYVGVGKEGPVMERTANDLYKKLRLEKAEHTEVFFDFLQNKTHGDALHLAAYNAFEKFYGKSED